jgi:hypothetical protein
MSATDKPNETAEIAVVLECRTRSTAQSIGR